MYIYQLGDGNMLKFENNIFSVEHTGYPVPDCEMHVGKKVYKNQSEIMRQILSYDIENQREFMTKVSECEDMDFMHFKYWVWGSNIGGGCPKKLQLIGKSIIDDGLTEKQAFFVYSVPSVKDISDIILPDDTFFEEYSSMVFRDWKYKLNKPNRLFKNNILMFTGLKKYSDMYLEYIIEAIKTCMSDDLKNQLHYVTVIVSQNNIGCIIFSDTTANNVDVEYFYSVISGVSLYDGSVIVNIDDNNIDISFNCVDERLISYYSNTPSFRGTIERKPFV